MVHGASMVHGPWPIHGAWSIHGPMVHLQSMVQDEDATMLRLNGKIFARDLDDFALFLDVFG